MKQTKFQLKNKLNVLLIESKKSPVVSAQMWVKTGSADESKKEEGISHFIEHLVFKGTDKYKVGEIANTVEASGGELNAYTSFDQTVFYVTISKNFTDVALDVVSQMMGYPVFDKSEVDSEREVVCEEIKMGQDSPNRRSSQLMFSNVFKKHPYGIPVIGYEKNVRSWSVKKIKEYYQSRYVPTNMFLVISGDFETPQMKKKVAQYFGGFKNYKLKKVKRPQEPKQKKFQFKAQHYKIQDRHLYFSFRAPNVKHKDVPALDVLAMILGQGDSSRLVKKLRLETPIVNSIGAFNYNPQDEGLFAISAHYQGDVLETVVEKTFQEIDHIQNNLVAWEEIKRARINLSAEQFYSVETVDGLANKAGSQEFYFKDQKAQLKYLKSINAVKPEDVRRVAIKYLKLDQLSASVLSSEDIKLSEKRLKKIPDIWKIKKSKNLTKIKTKTERIKIPQLTLKPARQQEKMEIEKIDLKSGIRILLSPSRDIPTVSAKFVFRGGARLETNERMGLSELASRVWVSSTKNRNEAQLMQEIEESAIGLSAFSGKNTFGFSVDYLSVFEDKALDLALDSILNCDFQTETIEREKQVLLQSIKSREDHPSSLCMRQFAKAMFGDHPLAYDATGNAESISRIVRDDLIQLKERILNPKQLVVSIVGDFNKKTWLEKIKLLESQIHARGEAIRAEKLKPLSETNTKFLASEKEQSHVVIGWRGLTLNDPDRYALEVIEAVLAGQGGRLFFELRDKNSLAYSVSPLKMESIETGYVGGYIACSHDKVEKAIEMFKFEFNKLCDELISEDELARAKRYLIGQHDIGLQKKSALCNLLAFDEIYNNDFNKSLKIANEYNKVTREQVRLLAQKLFTQNHVVSIVGKSQTQSKVAS